MNFAANNIISNTMQSALVGSPSGLIYHNDFRGDVVDRISGAQWKTILPSVKGKTVDRFGQLLTVGPDQARHTGAGVLLEGQGMNFIPYSEDFSQWTAQGSGTGNAPLIVSENNLAPDGAYTATRVQFALSGGVASTDQSVFRTNTGTSFANPHSAAFGVWVKSATGTPQEIWIRDFTSGTTGVVAVVGDEWARLADETALVTSGVGVPVIGLRGGTSSVDTADVIIWGAQWEESKKISSYIPTNGAPKTRATDAAAADGNGYQFPLDAMSDKGACFGRLVVDNNDRVRTPTGDELIDDTAASVNAGWWVSNNTILIPEGTSQWASTIKDSIITIGKSYILTGDIAGLTDGEVIQAKLGNDSTSVLFGVKNGPFTFMGKADGDNGNLQIQLRNETSSAVTITISVKEVQAEGTMVLKWVPGFGVADPTATAGLVSCADTDLSLLRITGSNVMQSSDASSVVNSAYAYSPGEVLTTIVRWESGGNYTIFNNGEQGTTQPFDGVYNLGTRLRLHYGNELHAEYQSLSIYNRALTDAEVASV